MVSNRLRTRRWGLLIAAALGASQMLACHADAAPINAERALFDLSGRCGLLKVDSVSVTQGRHGWVLHIGGLRRFANMEVGLDHQSLEGGTLTLEVVGCTPNFIAVPVPTPYALELPLREVPGARRVRIIAANGAVTRRLPGR